MPRGEGARDSQGPRRVGVLDGHSRILAIQSASSAPRLSSPMMRLAIALCLAADVRGLRAPLSRVSMGARRSGDTTGASKMSTKDMVLSKTKFASGGARVAGDDKEVPHQRWSRPHHALINARSACVFLSDPFLLLLPQMEILYKEFEKCFPNKQMAEEIAQRNSNVFNPQVRQRSVSARGTCAERRAASVGAHCPTMPSLSHRTLLAAEFADQDQGYVGTAQEALRRQRRAGSHPEEPRCAQERATVGSSVGLSQRLP